MLLLAMALLRKCACSFNALHLHIAYPLLMQSWLWHWLFRKPFVIREHWCAFHDEIHLPEGSRPLRHMCRPFQKGDPVLVVSALLLADMRTFAQCDDFKCFVLPTVVLLHGAAGGLRNEPVLFVVNRWDLDYETLSIAYAEDLGLEVSLIGPHIAAVAEYAWSEDWSEVAFRTPEAWQFAVKAFAGRWARSGWNIARRSQEQFSETHCARLIEPRC